MAANETHVKNKHVPNLPGILLYCLPSMQQHVHVLIYNAIKLSNTKPNYLRTLLLSFLEFIHF